MLILMEILTDNRNRTAPVIRKLLEKKGGSLGSAAWAFDQKGLIMVTAADVDEDALLTAVLEAGGEDMEAVDDCFQITTAPGDMETVRQALAAQGFPVASAEVTQVPQNPTPVDEETGRKVLELLEMLEDHDDVQSVYSNVDVPESLMAEMA